MSNVLNQPGLETLVILCQITLFTTRWQHSDLQLTGRKRRFVIHLSVHPSSTALSLSGGRGGRGPSSVFIHVGPQLTFSFSQITLVRQVALVPPCSRSVGSSVRMTPVLKGCSDRGCDRRKRVPRLTSGAKDRKSPGCR